MRPKGFDDALSFFETKKVPLGSWEGWLGECCRVVEDRYNFDCTWITLVGMTVGMLEGSKQHNAYMRVAKKKFNRPGEQRFLIFFVALSQALAGSNGLHLKDTYRGELGLRLRRAIPLHVLCWPTPGETRPVDILRKIQPLGTSLPVMRDTDLDFYVCLVHGYYTTSRSEKALELLYDVCSTHPGAKKSTACNLLLGDAKVMSYFASRNPQKK